MTKPFPTYFGGKEASGVYQTIINTIRPHDLFIEPFGGNYTISRKLNDNAMKWVNDISLKTFLMYPVEHPNNWMFTNMDGLQQMNLILCRLSEIFSRLRKVIYLDPPYPLSARKNSTEVYDHEMSDQDHVELLKFVLRNKEKADFIISTYPNSIYSSMLDDWNFIEYEGCDRHGKTTEWLFLNYDHTKLTALHDIRYYGSSYIDRQRIKRGVKNTIDKIKRIDPVIQSHVLDELGRYRFEMQKKNIEHPAASKIIEKSELIFLKQLAGK